MVSIISEEYIEITIHGIRLTSFVPEFTGHIFKIILRYIHIWHIESGLHHTLSMICEIVSRYKIYVALRQFRMFIHSILKISVFPCSDFISLFPYLHRIRLSALLVDIKRIPQDRMCYEFILQTSIASHEDLLACRKVEKKEVGFSRFKKSVECSPLPVQEDFSRVQQRHGDGETSQ